MPRKLFKVKAYSKSELAELYQINVKTLVSWLKNSGIETGNQRILWPNQVKALFDAKGLPISNYKED